MIKHTVKPGECLSSIGFDYGLDWRIIWNHAANADIRQKRKNPNVLYAGDILQVPEREERHESGQTENRHRFKKKNTPVLLKVRLLINGEPRKNRPYQICIDGISYEGKTNDKGFIECPIPADAKAAELWVINEDGSKDLLPLELGMLDPLETESGVKQRLANLAYNTRDDLAAALRVFQEEQGLDPTGVADTTTCQKLREQYGQ